MIKEKTIMKYAIERRLVWWVQLISAGLLTVWMAACVAMDNPVDHSVQIKRVGAAQVVGIKYVYGVLGEQKIGRLSNGGDGITELMPVPEFIDVEWTTEADGQKHAVHMPLKSKVSAHEVSGNIVRIEIEGEVLRVFLVVRLPDFREERKQIY